MCCRGLIVLTALLLLLSPGVVSAQLPESPVIIDVSLEGCVPRDEICGDGIDQDCDGADLPCPGADADLDGFPQGLDCDDNDRSVYPGISVTCDAACGKGTKTCGENGAYGECSCTPLCEAKSGGRCYYISKFQGNDANPGTYAQPFKSLGKISTIPGFSGVSLAPGDVVYLLSGIYDESYSYEPKRYGLYLRGVQGSPSAPIMIKAYPGQHPVISPSANAQGITISQSAHLILEGIEILRAYEFGMAIIDSQHIEVRNFWIHQTDGIDNDNLSGINFWTSQNVRVHHSRINDNYDRTNQDTGGRKTENSRNIVLFGGGNNRIDHNVIYQTPSVDAEKSGGCITYKHTSSVPNSTFEVDNNIFWNCAFHAIGTSAPKSHIHHNLIINSQQGIRPAEYGGPCELNEGLVEYNTIIGGLQSFSHFPYLESCSPLGTYTVRNNIFAQAAPYTSGEDAIVQVDPYGSDQSYTAVVDGGKLKFENNCYYNSSTAVRFHLYPFSYNPSDVKGGTYSFAAWKNLGFDNNSKEINPNLDTYFRPQEAACANAGHFAGK